MTSYTQFGYRGYPSASQILTSNKTHSNQSMVDPVADEVSLSADSTTTFGKSKDYIPNTTCDIPPAVGSPDAIPQSRNTTIPGNSTGPATPAENNAVLSEDTVTLTQLSAAGSPCCENLRPIITDPVSGQAICSCQYDSARLALSSYSRLPAGSVGVYGTPFPSTEQNPYQSIGVESSAFYSPLNNHYTLKESTAGGDMSAWTSASLQPTAGYYSYDPMSAYGYGTNYDLAARRKNATRESTATLKAWLNEHKKNPYPTKGEKIMLAIITKMTLTQVSTWFANARRRLKKENKMTWEPKNRTEDDDDAVPSDDEKDKNDISCARKTKVLEENTEAIAQCQEIDKSVDDDCRPITMEQDLYNTGTVFGSAIYHNRNRGAHTYHPYQVHSHAHVHQQQHLQSMLPTNFHHALATSTINSSDKQNMNLNNNSHTSDKYTNENNTLSTSKNILSQDCGVPVPASKPKIWSLADTVACKTPPPLVYLGQQHQQQLHQQHFMRTHLTSQTNLEQEPQQHIMSNFGGTSFTRTLTTVYENFQGATTAALQHPHAMNNLVLNINQHPDTNKPFYNNDNNRNALTSIIPFATSPNIQHLHHQHYSHHHPHTHPQQQQANTAAHHLTRLHHGGNQRGMGFPEAQPDTPPQTPPNMKLPNAHTTQAVSLQSDRPTSLLNSPLATVFTRTCCNSNNNLTDLGDVTTSMSTASPSYSGIDSNTINFSARYTNEYSPRDDSSIGSSSSGRSSASGSSSNSLRLNQNSKISTS